MAAFAASLKIGGATNAPPALPLPHPLEAELELLCADDKEDDEEDAEIEAIEAKLPSRLAVKFRVITTARFPSGEFTLPRVVRSGDLSSSDRDRMRNGDVMGAWYDDVLSTLLWATADTSVADVEDEEVTGVQEEGIEDKEVAAGVKLLVLV
jgi:hypothetical protein